MAPQAALPKLAIGQEFESVNAFKLAVRADAAAHGWNARYGKSEAHFTTMRCHQDACTFHVRAKTTKGTVKITRLVEEHTCLGTAQEGARSSNGEHQLLLIKIPEAMIVTPQTTGKAIRAQLKHTFGMDVGLDAVYKAKSALLGNSAADERASFRRIPAYVQALVAADPETRASYEGPNGQFERIFVCPAAARHAWSFCRRWLAVDATFTKNKYAMRLHLAATMDGTGSLVVIAWALTPGESTDNWAWFFGHLLDSLPELNTPSACIVSDRNAGLIGALDEVFPQAIKTWCCFHIAKNIKEHRHSEAAERIFWKMVYCRTKEQFDAHAKHLKGLDEAGASYIGGIEPSKWATCEVQGRRFGHVTSNLAEIANAMLLEARALPPLGCIEYIYNHQMERFFSRRVQAEKTTSPIVPTEYARLQAGIKEAKHMTAKCSDEYTGNVVSADGKQYVVRLPRHIEDAGFCDCGQYQQLLRPCKHAIALLQKVKKSVVPYYHGYYTTKGWREMYQHAFQPISTTSLEESDLNPPPVKRKRGRPQTERKEKGEGPKKRGCSICGEDGHRYKDCAMTWDP